MWQQLLAQLAMTLLTMTVRAASPIVANVLAEAGKTMYDKAKETPNPFDDILAVGILSATGQPTPVKKTSPGEPS